MDDIQTKEDLQLLVNSFYSRALADEQIGPVFKAADFLLDKHIPLMVSFWETILFDIHTYKGNPMLKHLELNQLTKLLPVHFERWMMIWQETITLNFEGPRAEEAVKRAASIGQMMQFKINKYGNMQ